MLFFHARVVHKEVSKIIYRCIECRCFTKCFLLYENSISRSIVVENKRERCEVHYIGLCYQIFSRMEQDVNLHVKAENVL